MQNKVKIFFTTIVIIIGFFLVSVWIALNFLDKTSPYLQQHRTEIEVWISGFLHQPVKFSSVEISHFRLEPVLKLHDFVILDRTTKTPRIKIREQQIGIDLLASLFKWRIIPETLVMKGANIAICQGPNNEIYITGLKEDACDFNRNGEADGLAEIKKLLAIKEIIFEDSNFTWLRYDGSKLEFTKLNIKLINSIFLQHKLKATGFLKRQAQPKSAQFDISLKIRGNIWQYNSLKINGRIILQDIYLKIQKQTENRFFPALPYSGEIRVYLHNPTIIIPGLWQVPLHFNNLNGVVEWRHKDQQLQLEIARLKLQDNYLNVGGDIHLVFSPNEVLPNVDAELDFVLQNVSKLKLYYPSKIMHKRLVAWLDQAFVGGGQTDGQLLLQGNLKDFPFAKGNNGKFKVDCHVHSVNLHYQKGWPILKNIDGELIFAGKSMHLKADKANLLNIPLANVTAHIDDLSHALLKIDGMVTTEAARGIQFLKSSPLRKILMHDLNITGFVQLILHLRLPIAHADQKVKFFGNLSFLNNDVILPFAGMTLKELQGKLSFDNDQWTGHDLHCEFLNRPLGIYVKTFKESGLSITGSIAKLNLSDWLGFLAQTKQNKASSLLHKIALNIGTFTAFGHSFKSVILAIAPAKHSKWLVAIHSKNINGEILVPKNLKTGTVKCVFKKLHLTTAKKARGPIRSQNIPRLHFVGKDVVYNGLPLGGVEFYLQPHANYLAINNIKIANQAFELTANGKWTSAQLSGVSGRIASRSFGDAFKYLHLTKNFEGGEGSIVFNFNWPSAFYNPSIKILHGEITLKIGKGRVVHLDQQTEAEMGFGRVLTLLSLQTLPRRLTLDFSDLFEGGYNFDSFTGKLQIAKGQLSTKDTKLDGTVARVGISGKINISQKSYDMILTITPKITSSIPVIATIFGGPVAGATTFVAEKVFGKVVGKMTEHRYKVIGSWLNPQFTKL